MILIKVCMCNAVILSTLSMFFCMHTFTYIIIKYIRSENKEHKYSVNVVVCYLTFLLKRFFFYNILSHLDFVSSVSIYHSCDDSLMQCAIKCVDFKTEMLLYTLFTNLLIFMDSLYICDFLLR